MSINDYQWKSGFWLSGQKSNKLGKRSQPILLANVPDFTRLIQILEKKESKESDVNSTLAATNREAKKVETST